MQADLPLELIEVLEKIILEPSAFSDNKILQSLLLLTAVKNDKGKVMGYIGKLQNYDPSEIANIAIEHGLYEEALTIYKKNEQHALAINVLVEYIVSIDRGLDYANKVNRPEVWSRLAKAQLDGLRIKDSIGLSYTNPPTLCAELTRSEIRLLYQGSRCDQFLRSDRNWQPRWQAR